MAQACPSCVALVDTHLLHIVAVGRGQRSAAGEPMGTVENLSLLLGADRHDSLSAALGPAGLQKQAIVAVGNTGPNLHRLFAAKAESLLQFQAHAHVLVFDLFQLLTSPKNA